MHTTRRAFCSLATTLLLSSRLPAQSKSSARPDVAAIDRDRILAAADRYLTQPIAPLTAHPSTRSLGTTHDYYSEAEGYWPDPGAPDAPYIQRPGAPNPAAFTAHRDALLNLSLYVPALTAAFVLTHEERYAKQAVAHLHAWFIDPATSMTSSLLYAQVIPPAKTGRPEGLVEAVHLAEVAQSIPFLANSEALSELRSRRHPEMVRRVLRVADNISARRPCSRPEEPPRQLLAPASRCLRPSQYKRRPPPHRAPSPIQIHHHPRPDTR